LTAAVWSGHWRAKKPVRTERWKYIQYTELEGSDELYDLRGDPYEMRNVIADVAMRGTLESLRAELQRLKQ
jgi:arylsulfatase A-like enzyme